MSTGEPSRKITVPANGLPDLTDTPQKLRLAAKRLRAGTGPVAVDTERASGYRYGQDAYLVQLRRDGVGTLLIDPVGTGRDFSCINDALTGVEWILHAADQDMPCLAKLGMRPDALFDTELAARILGREKRGLGHLIEDTLGWHLAKEHSAADWSVRPLPTSWLNYAALDVELLIDLRSALLTELELAGKLQWALAEFEFERTAPPRPERVDPWRHMHGAGRVTTARGRAILRNLWLTREEIAKAQDLPPVKVLPHYAIVAVAKRMPNSRKQLRAIREMSSRDARAYMEQWWKAVDSAMKLPESQLPKPIDLAPVGKVPELRVWSRRYPLHFEVLQAVRETVHSCAAQLTLIQENLLYPGLQRKLAWYWYPGMDVAEYLAENGARAWQIHQVAPALQLRLEELNLTQAQLQADREYKHGAGSKKR